jgi:hypothetical protein
MRGRFAIPMKFFSRSIRFVHVALVIFRERNALSVNVSWEISVNALLLVSVGSAQKSIRNGESAPNATERDGSSI